MTEQATINSRLFQAVRDDDLPAVDTFLRDGADIEAKEDEGSTPLHVAAVLGRCAMVRHLVAKGANINATNARGGTTLTMARVAYTLAVRVGHHGRAEELLELVRWLRRQGAADAPGTEPRKWWRFWK